MGRTRDLGSSVRLLRYPALLAQCHKLIKRGPQRILPDRAEPVAYDDVVAGDQEGDRLASNSVEVPDRLIETPLGVQEQFIGTGPRLIETRLTGHGDEPDRVCIIGLNGINDGQLPSTDTSPLCPEDQIDRLLLSRESELSAVSESKREVRGGRPVDRWGRCRGRLDPGW